MVSVFFPQIQNCYSIFAYLYKYMRFYDQFRFLFSGKFLTFSCVCFFCDIGSTMSVFVLGFRRI